MPDTPTLHVVEDDDSPPTTDELREALHSPGRLSDQPAVQRLMSQRSDLEPSDSGRHHLTLIKGEDESS